MAGFGGDFGFILGVIFVWFSVAIWPVDGLLTVQGMDHLRSSCERASIRGPTSGRDGILVGFLVGFLVGNLPSRWNRLGGDQGSAKTSSTEH